MLREDNRLKITNIPCRNISQKSKGQAVEEEDAAEESSGDHDDDSDADFDDS